MPVTTIDTIDAMPVAPDRSNPTAFPGLADTWMSAWTDTTDDLNGMIGQLNTYADEIEVYYDDTVTAKTATETAQSLAEDWAEKTTEVESGKYSAKYWAEQAISVIGNNDYVGHSTSSITIATGSKTCTIETGKSFVTNQFITIIDIDNNSNWLAGFVTSYTSGTGVLVTNIVNINNYNFAGNNWLISLSSPSPAQGNDFRKSFLL